MVLLFSQEEKGFSKPEFEQEWNELISQKPKVSKYNYPSDLAFKEDVEKLSLDSMKGLAKKAENLFKILNYQVELDKPVEFSAVETMVKFIEFVKKEQKVPKRLSGYSFYIHSEDGYIPFAMQFFEDSQIYIHLGKKDMNSKKGGYKQFSRSVRYSDLEVVAHLMVETKSKRELSNILNEIEIMKMFKIDEGVLYQYGHDLIVDRSLKKSKIPVGMVPPHSIPLSYYLTIVTPLYEGDLTIKRNNTPSAIELLTIAEGMVDSLLAFHANGVVHRDIKPLNYFYKGEGRNTKISLADFGLSQNITSSHYGEHLSGTRGYLDPMICRARLELGVSFSDFSEGIISDAFSLGVTLYSLIEGKKTDLKDSIYQVNSVALPPKGKAKGTVKDLEEKITEFAKIHSKVMQSLEQRTSKTPYEKVSNKLLKLALGMMEPDIESRLNLSEVKNEIESLWYLFSYHH